MIRILLAAFALALLPSPTAAAPLAGVNLSGCEFKGVLNGALCPTPDDVRFSIGQGFRLIRLPFKSAQLDDAKAWAKIRAVVAAANAAGVPVILDRHEFRWPPVEEQVAFWKRVLAALPAGADVKLDLMNEPKGFAEPRAPYAQWARDTKAIVAGIRAFAPRTEILVEWPNYSATFRFHDPRVAAIEADPRRTCPTAGCALDRVGGFGPNVALSGHRYFDTGTAGIKAECTSKTPNPATSIASFAEGARKRGMKAYVTEVAWGSWRGVPASCAGRGAAFLADVTANPDAIAGFTVWGGGRAWPERYIFRVDTPKAERAAAPVSTYVAAIVR
ncbi:cellulase family glycosylhydrolase [Sphingomonas profundi]|uniref:cellulase family glycosylhydrolase n=1 Tax=Alterirhizorhabdus profundi TaxID=2681549 RepID=UPI0012E97BA0|nr:cellulase family glycosylhydrolase [Sphingomonas profundi]